MTDVLIVARMVHFASVMALFGVPLFALYGGSSPGGISLFRPIRLALGLSAVLALASALAWLAAIIANMTGDWSDIVDFDTLGSVLLGTDFGQLWAWRLGLTVVLLAAVLLRYFTTVRRGQAAFTILAALLLASLALTGHAASHRGSWGVAHRVNQAVHLLAAGAWLGGLVTLGFALAATRRARSEAAIAWIRCLVSRFSRMGYWAVGLIALSGAVNSIFLVGSPATLLPTPYGRTLLAKVAVFLIMVAVAAANRLTLVPRLAADPPAIAPLWRNVLGELALGLAVLALASLLGTLAPAMYHEA